MANKMHSDELNMPELPLNSSRAHGRAVTFVLRTLGDVDAKLSLADIKWIAQNQMRFVSACDCSEINT